MTNQAFAFVFVQLTLVVGSQSARILFIVGTPSFSHQVVFRPIWRELSLRGHQVTALTTNPLKDPTLTNLTEVDLGFSYDDFINKFQFLDRLIKVQDETTKYAWFFLEALSFVNEKQLSHPEVKRIIEDETLRYDLLMVEYLLPTMLAFGHRFKCPVIALTSLDGTLVGQLDVGNPVHPALNPDNVLKFNIPLTFMERINSAWFALFRIVSYWFVIKREDAIIEEHFGRGYPSLAKLTKNIDMFFMNVNPAFHNIRPTVPAVVHIGGGMHFQPPKELPEELKVYLDEAKEGAIYFSLGTNVRTKNLPKQFFEAIVTALGEVPHKILWKFDDELPGKPRNVLVRKWLPQHDILRHPNVKLFITQGGIQSLEETIEARVPVIVFPSFADQFSNAILVERRGFGIYLDHHTVDKEQIKKTILEVIGNSTYKENVEKLANIAADQPMTGLEKAIWWTEYVLRHKGAKHLRSKTVDVPFYQLLLLDVIAFLAALMFTIGFILAKTTQFVCRCFRKLFSKCQKSDEKKLKES